LLRPRRLAAFDRIDGREDGALLQHGTTNPSRGEAISGLR
jgi:hypothetical protein